MAENIIKDVKLKIGTETQFQSKLKDLPLNTLVGTTDPIQEGELDTSIITKLEKADNALPKPTNDSTGSAGQVLKKTANGSEWGDVAGGTNVVANPTAAGTDTLTKLTVGDTTYNIPSGGGGGPTYSAGTHITIDSNNAINAEWPTAANAGYEGIGSTGTVTGIKMNGEVKGTEGVVNLGMVISEEQYANCAKLVGGNLFHGTQQIVDALIVGSEGIRTNGSLATLEGKILKPLDGQGIAYEYTLPDKSGTVALTSDIPDALPKPSNDTTGSVGDVLSKTANGSEWKTIKVLPDTPPSVGEVLGCTTDGTPEWVPGVLGIYNHYMSFETALGEKITLTKISTDSSGFANIAVAYSNEIAHLEALGYPDLPIPVVGSIESNSQKFSAIAINGSANMLYGEGGTTIDISDLTHWADNPLQV